MKIVDGNLEGLYDGVARIIWGDKGKTIYLSAMGLENDRFLSLNDCLKEIGFDGKGVVVVLLDDFCDGKVYMYENYHDKCWYQYGETRGFV